MAGRPFAQATELGKGPQQLFSAMQQNRENLSQRIGQMQQELQEWQELLSHETEQDGKHPLLKALEDVAPSNFLGQMFFGNLMRRREPRNQG